MLHYQSDVMMNGAILVALGLPYGWYRADALFALGLASIFYIALCVWVMTPFSRY